MKLGDLEIKATRAQDLAKKSQNIIIMMDVNSATEDMGRNLLLKFRDMISESLIEDGDVIETKMTSQDDAQYEEYEVDEAVEKTEVTKRFTLKVFNPEFKDKMVKSAPNIDEMALKRYIYDYFIRTSSKAVQGRIVHNPFDSEVFDDEQDEIEKKTELGNMITELRANDSDEAISERRSNLLKKLDRDMRKKFGGQNFAIIFLHNSNFDF